jgi:heptosyltransferase-3
MVFKYLKIIDMRKIVLYIVYGDDEVYYDGAKFSILTFMNWVKNEPIEIVILTEKPEKFNDMPATVLVLNEKQIKNWSLDGKYHFRIKNRGLAFVMDSLKLEGMDKILFFDTDTYFNKTPLPLFNLIKSDQALFYLNEGLIYNRKRFNVYVKSLEGVSIDIQGQTYKLSKKSSLWGSLMVGIVSDMRPSLEWSDLLMLKFYELVNAHTIEPFSLSETLSKNYKLVEGKKYVSLYSTSRKKEYASRVIADFFIENQSKTIDEKIQLAQLVKIKRPISLIFKQRFSSWYR